MADDDGDDGDEIALAKRREMKKQMSRLISTNSALVSKVSAMQADARRVGVLFVSPWL